MQQQNIIRLWAGLDLVITATLVLPPVAGWLISMLLTANSFLGGAATLDDVSGFGMLFVCMTGALGVLWASARLLRPTWIMGACDAVARLWIGALIVYFVFARGVPAILLLFVVSEWAGGLHQGWVLARRKRPEPDTASSPR